MLGVIIDDNWQELPKDESGIYLALKGDIIVIKTIWINTAGPEIPPYNDISINVISEPPVIIEGDIVGPMPVGTFTLRVVHFRRSASWAAWV